MSHLFGVTPDQVLAWPMHRWLAYKAWADDYQKQSKEAGRGVQR